MVTTGATPGRTRAELLEALLVERFTYLPQSPPGLCDEGPSAELLRQRRLDAAEAERVVLPFRRTAVEAPTYAAQNPETGIQNGVSS